jgi:hypothetical protein
MKTFDLTMMGVHEMSTLEMTETDGGVIWFVAAAALLLLASCNTETNIQIGGTHDNIQTSDSTQDGWSADSSRIDLCVKPW